MCRYIDDDEALKIIKKMLYETALNNFTTDRKFADACEEIAEHRLATWIGLVPTADVVEHKRGEWIERNVTQDRRDAKIPEWQSAKCSVCGKYHTTPYMYYFTNYDYCPNCGARMDERKEVKE